MSFLEKSILRLTGYSNVKSLRLGLLSATTSVSAVKEFIQDGGGVLRSAEMKSAEGCLGDLDSTYIPVKVAHTDIPRYRNRKGQVSVNVLVICDRNMNSIFILSGWEGSAADSRVLCDAVTRSSDLKVPHAVDPYEDDVPENFSNVGNVDDNVGEFIDQVESSPAWTMTNMAAQQNNPDEGRGKRKATSTMHRVWTYMEEKELVSALKELVLKGYKCDNGFKSGYLLLLENMIARVFTGCDLKGEPHINSKIHV
ncbi:hypothetical protein ACS0TY_002221 [Phlomoides rotata]